MLLSDAKKDVKMLVLQEDTSLTALAEKAGKTPQALNSVLNNKIVNAKFIEVLDALGYDIKLEYIKRPDEAAKEK